MSSLDCLRQKYEKARNMRGLPGTANAQADQRAGFGWRREWPTWLVLVLVYGGWIGLTATYGDFPVWLTRPALAVLLALHGSLQHEILHGHPLVRFLERDAGIEPTRLMSASRGENEPVAMENSKSARARNRRVEIVVVIPQDAALSMAK